MLKIRMTSTEHYKRKEERFAVTKYRWKTRLRSRWDRKLHLKGRLQMFGVSFTGFEKALSYPLNQSFNCSYVALASLWNQLSVRGDRFCVVCCAQFRVNNKTRK
jgi:hypothetical protein